MIAAHSSTARASRTGLGRSARRQPDGPLPGPAGVLGRGGSPVGDAEPRVRTGGCSGQPPARDGYAGRAPGDPPGPALGDPGGLAGAVAGSEPPVGPPPRRGPSRNQSSGQSLIHASPRVGADHSSLQHDAAGAKSDGGRWPSLARRVPSTRSSRRPGPTSQGPGGAPGPRRGRSAPRRPPRPAPAAG